MKNAFFFFQTSALLVLVFFLQSTTSEQDTGVYGYVPLANARNVVISSKVDTVSLQIFWLTESQLHRCYDGIIPVLSDKSPNSLIMLNGEDVMNLKDLVLNIKIVPHVASEHPYLRLLPEKMILLSGDSINLSPDEIKGFFPLKAIEYDLDQSSRSSKQGYKSRPHPPRRGLFCCVV